MLLGGLFARHSPINSVPPFVFQYNLKNKTCSDDSLSGKNKDIAPPLNRSHTPLRRSCMRVNEQMRSYGRLPPQLVLFKAIVRVFRHALTSSRGIKTSRFRPILHSNNPQYQFKFSPSSTQHAIQVLRTYRPRHPCGCHTCSSRPVRHRIPPVLQQRPERPELLARHPVRPLGHRCPERHWRGRRYLQPHHRHWCQWHLLLCAARLLHQQLFQWRRRPWMHPYQPQPLNLTPSAFGVRSGEFDKANRNMIDM